jgi:hypothetical protein
MTTGRRMTRETLAQRLRLAERRAKLALADVQAANWPTPSTQRTLIIQLALTATRLERVAKILDGSRPSRPQAYEFAALAVLVAMVAAVVAVAPRPVLPLAVALGYAAWATVFGPVHWANGRRTIAKATVAAQADTTPFADRVLIVHREIKAILGDIQPELGPKRRKAEAQLRVALDWITPAADETGKQSPSNTEPGREP